MKIIDLFTILLFLLFTVGVVVILACGINEARAAEVIDWTTAQSDVKLYTDQSITVNGYTVTVIDSSDTQAVLKVTKADGTEDGSGVYSVGETITTKDNALKVLVQKVDPKYTTEKHGDKIIVTGKNPCITLALFTPTLPALDIKITPDQTYYNSGNGEIRATLGVVNVGKGAANNVKITLNSDMDQTEGSKAYQVDALPGRSGSVAKALVWKVPVVDGTCTKYANVTVNYDDTLHKHYTVTYSCPIQIIREYHVSISKSVTQNCYMGGMIYASVTAKNEGGFDLHGVHLVDSVPAGFKVDSGREQLDTVFDLPMGKYKTIQYVLKPTATGKYQMPVAKVTFQGAQGELFVNSNVCTVFVDGADVTADRIVTADSGKAIVTLTMKNTGNVGTTVRMSDELPENVTLISGKLTNAEYLTPGESTTATYVIVFPENTEVMISGRVKSTDLNERSTTIELPDYTISAQSKQIITKDDSPAALYEKPQVKTTPVKPISTPVVSQKNNTTNSTQVSESKEGPDLFWIGVAILALIVIYIVTTHAENNK